MSETIETSPRGREDRQTAEQTMRRRRQPGSLNRMVASNLGIPQELLGPDYHYHWVNDVRGRVAMLSTHDDYDIVTMDELEDTARRNRVPFNVNKDAFGGDGSRLSVPVEANGTKAVLMRKPKAFYDADYEEGVSARQAMMAGRVYEGALDADLSGDAVGSETLSEEHVYVPQGNTLGDTAPRRRGPIPRRIK